MTFLAGLTGVAVASRLKSDLGIAVDEVVAAIANRRSPRKEGKSGAGLVEEQEFDKSLVGYAQALRRALWCKQVAIAVRATNPWSEEGPYSRLVNSADESLSEPGWHPLRSDGWTSRLGATAAQTVGAIFALSVAPFRAPAWDPKASSNGMPAARAWWIKAELRDDRSGEMTSALTVTEMTEVERSLTLQLSTRQHGDCIWIFAVKVGAGPQMERACDAVLWIHHREFGSCHFGTAERPDINKLQRYCVHVLDIASACAVIPSAWQAVAGGFDVARMFLQHGDFDLAMGCIAGLALRTQTGQRPKEALGPVISLAKYLEQKTGLYSDQGILWKPEALDSQVRARALRTGGTPTTLRALANESWEIATELVNVEEIQFRNNIGANVRVLTSEAHLKEVFVQAFRNCRAHGRWPNMSVTVSATSLDTGETMIRIEDSGTGLSASARRRRSVAEVLSDFARGRGGLGMHVVRVFGLALGGRSPTWRDRLDEVTGTVLEFSVENKGVKKR
jgi:hypothetical protein